MDFSFIEKIVINYLEAHPELVERLVTDLFSALITKITAQLEHPNTPAPKA